MPLATPTQSQNEQPIFFRIQHLLQLPPQLLNLQPRQATTKHRVLQTPPIPVELLVYLPPTLRLRDVITDDVPLFRFHQRNLIRANKPLSFIHSFSSSRTSSSMIREYESDRPTTGCLQ